MTDLERGWLIGGIDFEINSFLNATPRTLKDIFKLGISKYYQYGEIIVNTKNFVKGVPLEIEDLEMIISILLIEYKEGQFSDFSLAFLDALAFFTKTFFYFDPEKGIVYGELDKVLESEDLLKIKEAVSLQYGVEKRIIEKEQEDEDEKLKKAREKLEETRRKVSEIKQKSNEENPIFKYLSRFALANPNVGLQQVLEYTMYQFTLQFSDFLVVESGERNLRSLLAGADPKKVKYVHWTK